MRELAKIKIIGDLNDIEINGEVATNIQLATIEGWNCVVKRGEFEIGDKCLYLEIDSIAPNIPQFEFLASKKFRVKTMKFNRWNVISQGLALPVNIFPELDDLDVETDVTELLGIKKYELPEWDKQSNHNTKFRPFPSFIPKTDEQRIESKLALLDELKGKPYYITIKMNGGSATYFNYERFGMCSRNQEIVFEDDYKLANGIKNMALKYDLENILKSMDLPTSFQGELCGPSNRGDGQGIGNNEDELFFFNMFDIMSNTYYELEGLKILQSLGLPIAPILEIGDSFNLKLNDLQRLSEGHYPSGILQEGIVIRPQTQMYSPSLRGRLSFKCINKMFLLGEK